MDGRRDKEYGQAHRGYDQGLKNGNELTLATKESFGENMEISAKVGELVEKIAAASKE